MKCVRCGTDSKLKERPGKICPGCRKQFAFEPRERDKFTDVAFQNAIDAVSAKGAVRFGVEHLYYEMSRKARSKSAASCLWPGAVLMLIGAIGLYFDVQPLGIALSIGVLGVVIGVVSRLTRTVKLSQDEFNKLWARWIEVHGKPKSLIERKPTGAAAKRTEADVEDYSFDRAVICDRARTVDLLLANNFHFENNCAVLAINGYPTGPFAVVRKMLKRNPRLQVYALHDATPTGCRLAFQLANDPEWFKDQARVTDVGIRPSIAGSFKGLLLPADGPVTADHGISPEEAKWLSTYKLELAAIRPEQVLKRLFRAINRKESDPIDGSGDGGSIGYSYYTDDDSFSADAGTSDGGADSFG